MGVKVFLIEPTNRQRRWLRRYSHLMEHKCAITGSYCNAQVPFGESDITYDSRGFIASSDHEAPSHTDPRWPTKCEACDYVFTEQDPYQLYTSQLYVRRDTNEQYTLREAPPGACWEAWWVSDRHKEGPTGCGYHTGPDHRCIVVKCPDGKEWMIDGRANNCTMPNDNTHNCWVRHGTPGQSDFTVDKNGHTCGAGAGSIDTGTFHGFLRNGEFT